MAADLAALAKLARTAYAAALCVGHAARLSRRATCERRLSRAVAAATTTASSTSAARRRARASGPPPAPAPAMEKFETYSWDQTDKFVTLYVPVEGATAAETMHDVGDRERRADRGPGRRGDSPSPTCAAPWTPRVARWCSSGTGSSSVSPKRRPATSGAPWTTRSTGGRRTATPAWRTATSRAPPGDRAPRRGRARTRARAEARVAAGLMRPHRRADKRRGRAGA